ncbi:MAG TPA: NAD(P)/FAD-dependent oxidoreductase [Candidatus Acidoferrales bacterium]|nr:NAD(P)/FAD-dependent oxidoreductase [Candidatus Acidoferrales bacterium]
MALSHAYDAVVIGSGPNGLAAAITIAQHGRSVAVFESQPTIGGGVRSGNLTVPGFTHDVCSAIYPLAIGSPFFRQLPLNQHGLQWIQPPAPLAHPLDDGSAVILERSVDATCANLGADGNAYRKLMQGLVERWEQIQLDLLAPPRFPRHPFSLARFGLHALRPARRLAEKLFSGERARALFAGLAAHSMLPLEYAASAAFGLVLGAAAHALGWPVARGGAQKLADALSSHLRQLGGEIIVNRCITSLDELPSSRVVLCDLTPRQLLRIAGNRFAAGYRRSLERYRYGVGAFKIDWALSAPVPWKATSCARAATVHLGGALDEIALSERAAWRGDPASRPFVLVAQPSLFDDSRAPATKHTLWAYCHVPHGFDFDMTERIEAQIERFAPGFRDVVIARSVMGPRDLERHNANLVGGDINGGAAILPQLFFRPTVRLYKTSLRGLYICSSSTPPGGGVHGMCGRFAALEALKEMP